MSRALMTIGLVLVFSACAGLGGEPAIVATLAPQLAATPSAQAETRWRPNIERGAAIFAQRCAECHGLSGDGQGELVLAGSVAAPIDMTDRDVVAAKSPLEWFEVITAGVIENLMPPWENALSEGERWDVALYAYTLAYDDDLLARGERIWRERCDDCEPPAVIPPAFSDVEYGARLNGDLFAAALTAEEQAGAAAYARMASLASGDGAETRGPVGEISGRLAHGTAGGIVPPDTVVQLQYGTAETGFSLAEAPLDENLRFTFRLAPLRSDYSYALGVVYNGRLFSRHFSAGEANDLTLTIYDVTEDPSVVQVNRIDLFAEALKLADLGPGLYITQMIGLRNESDRIFTSGRRFDDGREAVLLAQFPQGARPMGGDEGGRYIRVENIEGLPDSLIDTRPVPPGEGHQVILEYFLPYEDGVEFRQEFNHAIDASLGVTLSPGLAVTGDMFSAADEAGGGEGLSVHAGRLKMAEAPRLQFVISGDPFAQRGDSAAVVASEDLPGLLLGAGAIGVLALAGLSLARRRGAQPAREIESLVRELARLDEDHDQGRINHDLWHQRRRELKARLAALMDGAG